MLVTKLLKTEKEKEEFDKALRKTFIEKISRQVGNPLGDLDYFAVIDNGKIVAGCKLAYSKGFKHSNSSTGHKSFAQRSFEKYDMGLNLKDYVKEGDNYVEISRLFSTISKDAVTVLVTDLCELLYEQGVDYAIALVGEKMIKVIQRNFGIVEKLKEEPIVFPNDYREYYLIKITHELIKMWKELGYKHSPLPSNLQLENKK